MAISVNQRDQGETIELYWMRRSMVFYRRVFDRGSDASVEQGKVGGERWHEYHLEEVQVDALFVVHGRVVPHNEGWSAIIMFGGSEHGFYDELELVGEGEATTASKAIENASEKLEARMILLRRGIERLLPRPKW